MALSRKDVKAPVLRREVVPVPALGGEVIVRAMLLEEKLAVLAAMHAPAAPLPGESAPEAKTRANSAVVSLVLSTCVIDPDGVALMTRQEWREFGGQHMDEALVAFNKALELSGFDAERVEKN